MAQYASSNERERIESTAIPVADPVPLGMSALAFTTAIVGCSYAGFIIPSLRPGLSLAVAAALFYGGIVQILAGMWEFKKDNTVAATIFSSYGGFLVAFGVVFLPNFGIFSALNNASVLHPAVGLFFLCWTIFTGVLFLGSLRTNIALLLVLALLFLSYLLLTIGELAGANAGLLAIGGWLGIICALVAWYTALADMLTTANSTFRLPLGRIG
jgi:succinate-acetate transporter protein